MLHICMQQREDCIPPYYLSHILVVLSATLLEQQYDLFLLKAESWKGRRLGKSDLESPGLVPPAQSIDRRKPLGRGFQHFPINHLGKRRINEKTNSPF